MTDDLQAIVIDNGSGMIKAGFAGSEFPQTAFPSIIGRIRNDVSTLIDKKKDRYVGDEALLNACIYKLTYPIEHGIIKNWDHMETIWHHTFYNELKVDPSEHPVLLTEAAINPYSNRDKMIEMMFETFNVPSFYVGTQGYLSIFSAGRTTGLVCEVGDGVTQIVPVEEGYLIPYAMKRNNFAGRECVNWLHYLFEKRGYSFSTSEEMEIIRDIMEKKSYVALDYDAELQKAKSTSECDAFYTLPDRNTITVVNERFQCTELLFKPFMYGFDYDGIDKLVFDSIMKCPKEFHRDLFSNIVLSGGMTMVDGFPERIEKEITNLASPIMKINVIAPSDRKYAAWIGGSIMASLDTFSQRVITHGEYNEYGPLIANHKCI